jgi:hypothetical protein
VIGQYASRTYWREISAVLLLKAVAIIILYGLFFGPSTRLAITPESIAGHLEQSGGQP